MDLRTAIEEEWGVFRAKSEKALSIRASMAGIGQYLKKKKGEKAKLYF